MVVLTREQIEERLVALHRASLELVSDLSLETVLERITNIAREQVRARYAALGVVNEYGELEQFISVGFSSEELAQMEHTPLGLGLLGAITHERKPIRIPVIADDPRSYGFPPNHPPMSSFLGVPILLGDFLLGQIYLTNKETFPEFTEDDERVIETLAAYAAVAISNARLYKDLVEQDRALEQRNEDLSLLNDVAVALTNSLDLEEVLDSTLTRVMSYLAVEAGEIFLREEDSHDLRLAMHRGEAPEAFWTKDNFHLGQGVVGSVGQNGNPSVCEKLDQEVGFLRPAVWEAGFHSLASIPLASHAGVVGVMNLATRKEHNFDKHEINLLVALGKWAGITIENARLHRQVRRVAVLEERERIGMDLHDGIIQSIYAVGLELDFARLAIEEDPVEARQKIEKAIAELNSTIGDIRSYISDLRPRQLGGGNLLKGLQRLVAEYKANTHAEVALNAPQDSLSNLPNSHATVLFHICQEALANVAKHSHAKHTQVNLWTTKDRVLLEVIDNGHGFDTEKMSMTLGHGLSNMHTRARKVGGDVEITSEPDSGTTVLAWVPFPE